LEDRIIAVQRERGGHIAAAFGGQILLGQRCRIYLGLAVILGRRRQAYGNRKRTRPERWRKNDAPVHRLASRTHYPAFNRAPEEF
jgi:hypothetical protein